MAKRAKSNADSTSRRDAARALLSERLRVPAFPQPDDHLGSKPKLKDEDDLETALAWLRAIATWQGAVEGALAELTQLLEAAADDLLHVEIDGELVDVRQYAAAIDAAVSKFAGGARRRKKLFADSRTIKLRHGELRLRQQALRIVCADGDRKETLARLIAETGADKALREALEAIGAAPYLRARAELDLQGLKTKYEAGELTDEDLAAHGFSAEKPEVLQAIPKEAA